jgi:NAD(P)-dependent dehydrogenase (short-subunit alcohol dehydrogenase family)
VVVITGSTRGIGRGLAEQLLARGASVMLSGRSQDAVEDAVIALAESAPGRVAGLACDVRDLASVQELWDAAMQVFDRVDVWVNNAGVSAPRRPVWEVEADQVDAVVGTNLTGTLHCLKVALAGMREQGHGTVYNMEGFGSTGQTAEGMATYGASKRAVSYLVKATRKEVDGTGVRVGILSPGIVVTDLLLGDYEGQPEQFEKAKKVFNILGDDVDTVTSWIADRLLSSDPPPLKIRWLTGGKAFRRFLFAPLRKRDLFADIPTPTTTV